MGIFGWDLPPGCTMGDIERATGGDGTCLVCGKVEDDCICPECPKCKSFGDSDCYLKHGLIISDLQIEGQRSILLDIMKENDLWDSLTDEEKLDY